MGDACDGEIFKNGHSIAMIDACMHRAEEWVQSVAKESGQRVDWHYSGGIANVLYIGDYARVLAAVEKLRPELEKAAPKLRSHRCRCGAAKSHDAGRVWRVFPPEDHGPYRAGDPLPEDVVAVCTTVP